MQFGDKVKAARYTANMTQQELADLMHLSRRTISLYEMNRRVPKNAGTVIKLSKALNDEEALVHNAKMLEFAQVEGELSQKALNAKLDEYKAALRASIKLTERQEETIKSLNEELKESEAALIALRKEQSERLKGIRHQVEQLNALLEPPIEQQMQSSIKQFPLPKKT